jgi:hypothetical protein
MQIPDQQWDTSKNRLHGALPDLNCISEPSWIDRAAPRPGRARGGRPPCPAGLMVRAFILETLYGLSDEPMQFQVLDRLSFQRSSGVRRGRQVPGRTPGPRFGPSASSRRNIAN